MPNARGKILIVDDDKDIRVGTRIRLQFSGYSVVEATDGMEGVQMAIEHQPDCILLDVRMPRMDGLTALARIRDNEATRHIPVLMLSASLVDQTAALDAGARFFLEKPYAGEKLLDAIQAATEAIEPSLS